MLISLNSNLILLIRNYEETEPEALCSFKFQSDSINTNDSHHTATNVQDFKFQSDSINTLSAAKNTVSDIFFKFQSDSINTSDILQYRTVVHTYFKFQSDSINTNSEHSG